MPWTGAERIIPPVNFTLYAEGVQINDFVQTWSHTRHWGGKQTWNATFVHYEGRLVTIDGNDNPLNPLVQQVAVPNKELTCNYVVAGMSPKAPHILLGGTPEFDGDVMSWSGEDLTRKYLERPNQKMDDIISDVDGAPARYVHEVIKEIAGQFDTEVRLEFPDQRIKNFRRSGGTPINWIDNLTKFTQSGRFYEGRTLVIRQKTGGSEWNYKDRHNLEKVTVSIDITDLRNKYVISRLEPQTDVIGEKSCIGPECLGFQEIPLEVPSRVCTVQAEVTRGELIEWVWDGEDGTPVGTGPHSVHAMPATRGRFNYEPAIAIGTVLPPIMGGWESSATEVWTPRYEIFVFGSSQRNQLFATEYTFEATDAASQIFGEWAEDNIEDDAIWDSEMAQAYLAAILAENISKIFKGGLSSRYVNPVMNPGDWVAIVDRTTGQVMTRWFVRSITIARDIRRFWLFTLQLTKGLG